MKTKHNDSKSVGRSKSSSTREIYSDTNKPQEMRKISNKQSNLIPKQLEKEGQRIPKVSQRKEIKGQRITDINKIETKK